MKGGREKLTPECKANSTLMALEGFFFFQKMREVCSVTSTIRTVVGHQNVQQYPPYLLDFHQRVFEKSFFLLPYLKMNIYHWLWRRWKREKRFLCQMPVNLNHSIEIWRVSSRRWNCNGTRKSFYIFLTKKVIPQSKKWIYYFFSRKRKWFHIKRWRSSRKKEARSTCS